ncbi:MAG: hypothetical protein GY845_03380 [Planctomycetes bacterium]|nr:hypothetical protein [Planctomycetota bacterium]
MGDTIYPVPGSLKSIQAVSITINTSQTTGDATITAIGSRYRILWNGYRTGDNDLSEAAPTVEKIDSTTLRATRGSSSATGAVIVNVTVEDLY